MRRFHIIACHVLWREFCYYAALSENVFTFHFLKNGLHNEPNKLRAAVQAAIGAAEPTGQDTRQIPLSVLEPHNIREDRADAILLGYGLCSNGLHGITARSLPLVAPRAHDCITLLLGSKERYREYFDGHPGTYWYSPGWIDTGCMPGSARFQQLREKFIEKYGEDNADYLMEIEMGWIKKYTRATYVDLGFGKSETYLQYTRQCATQCGWQCDTQNGDPRLFNKLLSGDWNDADFLVVPPGQTIMPSDDETVLKVKP
ncbi:MAG: DUF1638 domain-containing protein [Planctomycetota bacterium]